MCELLGLSLKTEADPGIYFKEFQGKGKDSPATRNPDGWGIAWYPDGRAAALIKEEIPAYESEMASFLAQSKLLRSRTFIAHVRKKSRGEIIYRNTHPFCRELNGREYAFAHNGTVRGEEQLVPGTFRPVGGTDSERLFCHILQVVRDLGGISVENYAHLWDALLSVNQLTSQKEKSKVNILLTDGDTLIAYRDMFGQGTLYRLQRPDPSSEEPTALGDGNIHIESGSRNGEKQKAAVIATKKFTAAQDWEMIEPGEMCIFKGGELVFSSASGSKFIEVEVYDSFKWLDERPEAPNVAGMPLALRNALGVSVGDTVIVSNGRAQVKLIVYRTDKRLLSSESCQALSSERHICLPSEVRRRLGLVKTNPCHGTEESARTYTPVCIERSDLS